MRYANKESSQPEYSNISQYFSFTISKKEFNAKVKQYNSSKKAYKKEKEKEKENAKKK